MRSQPPAESRPKESHTDGQQSTAQQSPHPSANPRQTPAADYDQEFTAPPGSEPPAHLQSRRPDTHGRHRTTQHAKNKSSTADKVTRLRWWPVLVPLALLALGISVATPAGRHQWALSLFRQPTDYTSLSFDNAAALPATAVLNKPLTVSFNIGNNEGKAIKYHYIVSESPPGKSKNLYSAEKTVAADSTVTIPVTVRPTCPSSPCKVEVSLLGHPETIDFLVNLTA